MAHNLANLVIVGKYQIHASPGYEQSMDDLKTRNKCLSSAWHITHRRSNWHRAEETAVLQEQRVTRRRQPYTITDRINLFSGKVYFYLVIKKLPKISKQNHQIKITATYRNLSSRRGALQSQDASRQPREAIPETMSVSHN